MITTQILLFSERSCGVRPIRLNLSNSSLNDNKSVIDAITCHFRIKPSVTEIKTKFMFAQPNAESSPRYMLHFDRNLLTSRKLLQ